jgi:hypothetical protein
VLASEVTPGLQQEQSPTPISFMSRINLMGDQMGRDPGRYSFNSGNRAWYVENKGGLDPTFVSKLSIRWIDGRLNEMSEQDCLGHQAFDSLRRKNSEDKILLTPSFKELKGGSTGSSNSEPFSIEKAQELIRNPATITVIQPTSSYNSTTRLDPPIPSCSNTV